MSDLTISRMSEVDVPELLALEKECFDVPWTEKMFRDEIKPEGAASSLVYREDGRIEGYVIAWFGYGEVHILSIGVRPGKRGRGIADALLDRALAEGAGQGCARAILEVRRGNLRAQSFYRRKGFRMIGVRRGYYSESGEDALVLEKEIGG
ncbi:MAG: ribosomal protein S18-alanine N-acetyltransferase [Candidatus Krumholzibacteria bacterium]|jgi:ribosomal-protein-alanine N-acetyltransferase|nr:ribosomal protein S18-alanine N-acetyltransferase [Candidatus Krumholzibacteria bacterium]